MDMIIHIFKKVVIDVAVDGSEDSDIHIKWFMATRCLIQNQFLNQKMDFDDV